MVVTHDTMDFFMEKTAAAVISEMVCSGNLLSAILPHIFFLPLSPLAFFTGSRIARGLPCSIENVWPFLSCRERRHRGHPGLVGDGPRLVRSIPARSRPPRRGLQPVPGGLHHQLRVVLPAPPPELGPPQLLR